MVSIDPSMDIAVRYAWGRMMHIGKKAQVPEMIVKIAAILFLLGALLVAAYFIIKALQKGKNQAIDVITFK